MQLEVFDVVFKAGLYMKHLPARDNQCDGYVSRANEGAREGFKSVFHVGLRDRLVRDVDFDSSRFSSAAEAFL